MKTFDFNDRDLFLACNLKEDETIIDGTLSSHTYYLTSITRKEETLTATIFSPTNVETKTVDITQIVLHAPTAHQIAKMERIGNNILHTLTEALDNCRILMRGGILPRDFIDSHFSKPCDCNSATASVLLHATLLSLHDDEQARTPAPVSTDDKLDATGFAMFAVDEGGIRSLHINDGPGELHHILGAILGDRR